MRINTVKQALKEGKTQFGCSTSMIRSPEVPRILAAAGLDWTYLDSEHGGFDLETLQDLCTRGERQRLVPHRPRRRVAIRAGGARPGLRRARRSVPARRVARVAGAGHFSWTRFPPAGVRGFGLQPTHLGYEMRPMPEIIAHMNANTMVVLQIETKTALDRIDELLSVPRIDAVMIGPADLSVSLGVARPVRAPHAGRRHRENSRRLQPPWHRARHPYAVAEAHPVLARSRHAFLSCNSEIGFLLEKARKP